MPHTGVGTSDLPAVNDTSIVRIPLTVQALANNTGARQREPITFGVPFAAGRCQPSDRLVLVQDGRRTAVQTSVLDTWPDGSVRWLLIDGRVDFPSSQLELIVGDSQAVPSIDAAFSVRTQGGGVQVSNGTLEGTISSTGQFPLAVRHAGRQCIEGARLVIRDAQGAEWKVAWPQSPVIRTDGPMRAVVALHGEAVGPDRRVELDLAFTVLSGVESVGCRLTIRNPATASHPGGKWDLGDPKSILLSEVAVHVPTPAAVAQSRVRPEPGAGWTAGEQLLLFQASSGGDRWNGSNHLNRDHAVALDFKGYEVRTGTRREPGLRATPTFEASGNGFRWTVAAHYFWQMFPKAVESTGDAVVVSMFPRHCASPQELQPGEQTTWDFFIGLGDDTVSTTALDWVVSPLAVAPTPDYYASTGAVPYLTPDARDRHSTYRSLVRQAIDGPTAFTAKREIIDQYGWRHFGDVYGDHEAVFHKGPDPLVSHWNNQYDAIHGGLCQFMRSGDTRWMLLGLELAGHVVDVDIYHATNDKSAYNGGLFWHTAHYIDADTATHRTYPSRAKVNGGGPSCGHLYTTGLMHAYFMTGDPRHRAAVIGLADYVINCDDGRLTPFRWLASGATGHATVSGVIPYHGPGRAPANALNALIDGHRLTNDERYLDKAFEVVKRVIHPHDDIDRQDLLDAENKWFYTMFLQSLGKLLDHLAGLGRRDDNFHYVRLCLVNYAKWMADRERPFLDHPERLEYPTETWAAQDMRKSEVFQYAAKYAPAADRPRLFERATFFFNYATEKLSTFETRGLCRPVVLMMANGWSRTWYLEHLDSWPVIDDRHTADFGKPITFVPQKEIAIGRAKRLLVGAAGAFVVSATLAVMWLLG